MFSQAGTVESVNVIEDRDTGCSRGFAFVEMSSTEEGNAAIQQFNGHDVGGRTLNVNEAKAREERGGSRGGSVEAAITAAVALATNSVAGNSGDGFNSKASVGMLPRKLCFGSLIHLNSYKRRERENSMEKAISGMAHSVSSNACCCAILKH